MARPSAARPRCTSPFDRLALSNFKTLEDTSAQRYLIGMTLPALQTAVPPAEAQQIPVTGLGLLNSHQNHLTTNFKARILN